MALVAPRRPSGGTAWWVPGEAAALADHLRCARESGRPALVLLDDVCSLAETDVEDLVLRLAAARGGEALVGAGSSAELAGAYRGLPVLLRRAGRGVLLGTGPRVEGEVLGLRSLPAPGPGPGAGFLVGGGGTAGTALPVRLAAPRRWAEHAPAASTVAG
ncbi:hypothetical protein GCM10023225_06520 [Kineococcus glutinatus]|uniref:AAA ATPase-like protein n=1 Tax=Kineococcus glutinatus TaxID=1070872 RepID=A0ABP9HBE6_9ACTN